MKPDAFEVEQLLRHCVFKDDEPKDPFVKAEGVLHTFHFHPGRLEEKRAAIADQLAGLPDSFRKTGGGGHSFLAACMTRENEQWGEHPNIEMLMCLGLAAGLVRYCLPKDMWSALPGAMPYFVVDLPEVVS